MKYLGASLLVVLHLLCLESHSFLDQIHLNQSVSEYSVSSVTPWTVVHQAPLSMGFFRQEC